MKTLTAMAVGLPSMFASGVSSAQNDNMMDGGGMGDSWMGGYWEPIVLVVVVGFVVWAILQKRK